MMPGMIMLWYGSVASIPSGWHLCDGDAGTIDLRNKFIVCAGDTYAPAAVGGADSQTHTFTGDGHVHPWYGPAIYMAGTDHQDRGSTVNVTGTTNSADNRPAYKALCYIQKL